MAQLPVLRQPGSVQPWSPAGDIAERGPRGGDVRLHDSEHSWVGDSAVEQRHGYAIDRLPHWLWQDNPNAAQLAHAFAGAAWTQNIPEADVLWCVEWSASQSPALVERCRPDESKDPFANALASRLRVAGLP